MPALGISANTPMRFELSVRGIAQIHNELAAKNVRFVRSLKALVKNYGEATKQLTAFLAPVDTTYMQTHVKVFYTADGMSFEVGWDVDDFVKIGEPFYPFFQEFGTVKMAAQPSLTPAFQDMSPLFTRDLTRLAELEWRRLGSS